MVFKLVEAASEHWRYLALCGAVTPLGCDAVWERPSDSPWISVRADRLLDWMVDGVDWVADGEVVGVPSEVAKRERAWWRDAPLLPTSSGSSRGCS